MTPYDYVIVGAGMAGDAAIGGIRRRDANGSILMIGDEAYPPYQRPPLSKKLWIDMRLEDIFLRSAERHRADLVLTASVEALDRENRLVHLRDGRIYEYGRLLLATGARARSLPGTSAKTFYVGTLGEHIRLRRALSESQDVVVVGGGFIGAEMASVLAQQDHRVTWLVYEEYPFAGFFPRLLADHVRDEYTRHGVAIVNHAEVQQISDQGGRVRVAVADGTWYDADAAIVGVGVAANDALARRAGLITQNGIRVDAELQTADPHIWAAGDAAVLETESAPMMHEDHALSQGRLAGENMAGAHKTYQHQSFYYSDLFHFGYEAVGSCRTTWDVVEDWVDPGNEGVVYYLESGRVRGVLNWNVWDGIGAARALIESRESFSADDLRGRIRNT